MSSSTVRAGRPWRRIAATLLPLFALSLLTAAAPPAAPWSATIGESGIGAYRVGNPQAKVKLVQYFSYTCPHRSEEHTSELQSLMRISYAVFCLKKKNDKKH